jgi:hypothetical protein
MGFSPGDFKTSIGGLHFEAKDGGRIVLWSHNELTMVFEIDIENARKIISHLRTCLHVAGEEE